MKRWQTSLAFCLAALTAAGGAAGAEVNNQDERINFDRSIKETVDNFRILRTTEKAQMNDYVARVFELKNAQAMEIIPYVRNAVTKEAGSVNTLRYIDPETKKERHFIQVVAPPFQMAGIEELIKAFDLPGVASSPGDVRFFYRMQHRNAADVNTFLRASELSGDGASAVDDPTNTIYFRDSMSDFKTDLSVVRFMDVPVPQVELEVKIYELDCIEEDRLGLYWDAWKNALTGGVFAYAGSDPAFPDGYRGIVGIGGTAAAQFLNYLVTEGAGKVVTSAKVSVQNGETATVSSLKRIPYQDYTQVLSLGDIPLVDAAQFARLREQNAPNAPGGTNETSAVDPGQVTGEKSEGVWLQVTPSIGVKTLSAVTTVTVNSLVGFTKLEAPIVSERRATTTATLTPGEVFVLGGMDKETRIEEKRYVPLLGQIPLLGRLFSYDVDVARKTVLIVTIKPTVRNQLLYKALGFGPLTPPNEETLSTDVLAPNPGANAGGDAVTEGLGETPSLRWGESLWRNK